jgi:hypothetical protein
MGVGAGGELFVLRSATITPENTLQNSDTAHSHSERTEESAVASNTKADSSTFGLGMTANFEITSKARA